jgi:hypothetical protein
VGAGHKGWRRKVSSAAPAGPLVQDATGGSGAQFAQLELGIGCVPNSSNSIIGCVNARAPNSGLRGAPVGMSKL